MNERLWFVLAFSACMTHFNERGQLWWFFLFLLSVAIGGSI